MLDGSMRLSRAFWEAQENCKFNTLSANLFTNEMVNELSLHLPFCFIVSRTVRYVEQIILIQS